MVDLRRRRPEMRLLICAALGAGIALGGSSGVFAQRIGVDIYNDEPYCEHSCRETGTRRRPLPPPTDEDRPDVVKPIRPAGCGEFGYWNGKRCVDTPVVPSDMR
jgi:hypothetical protein